MIWPIFVIAAYAAIIGVILRVLGLRARCRKLSADLSERDRQLFEALKAKREADFERERSCKMFDQAREQHNREIQMVQRDRERLMESLTEVTAYGETLGMHPTSLVSLQALEASAAARKRNLAMRHALVAAMTASPSKEVAWYRMAEAALGMKVLNESTFKQLK